MRIGIIDKWWIILTNVWIYENKDKLVDKVTNQLKWNLRLFKTVHLSK